MRVPPHRIVWCRMLNTSMCIAICPCVLLEICGRHVASELAMYRHMSPRSACIVMYCHSWRALAVYMQPRVMPWEYLATDCCCALAEQTMQSIHGLSQGKMSCPRSSGLTFFYQNWQTGLNRLVRALCGALCGGCAGNSEAIGHSCFQKRAKSKAHNIIICQCQRSM